MSVCWVWLRQFSQRRNVTATIQSLHGIHRCHKTSEKPLGSYACCLVWNFWTFEITTLPQVSFHFCYSVFQVMFGFIGQATAAGTWGSKKICVDRLYGGKWLFSRKVTCVVMFVTSPGSVTAPALGRMARLDVRHRILSFRKYFFEVIAAGWSKAVKKAGTRFSLLAGVRQCLWCPGLHREHTW